MQRCALALLLLCPSLGLAHEYPCDDGVDDDLDGAIDCMDSDCSLDANCLEGDCLNGLDDNENGLIDCLDPGCWEESHCIPENCTNGRDDDSDGDVDCEDDECLTHESCVGEECRNGVDDDGDGDVDCDDLECCGGPDCPPISNEICLGFSDEDCDSLVDCADPDCAGQPNCLTEDCSNGLDDDADLAVDCQDPDCLEDPSADCDGDGASNGSDCAPADGGSFAEPTFLGRSPLRVVSSAIDGHAVYLTWPSLDDVSGTGTVYDVLRGDLLSQLWAEGSLGEEVCRADGLVAPAWEDFVIPGPEDASFYFLVRGRNACPAGMNVGAWEHDVAPLEDCP